MRWEALPKTHKVFYRAYLKIVPVARSRNNRAQIVGLVVSERLFPVAPRVAPGVAFVPPKLFLILLYFAASAVTTN